MTYQVPILFTVFNRPAPTGKVFQKIRQQKPLYLYIAADGPRSHVPTDAKNCTKTRAIMDDIDWPCTVKTRYLDTNLGCGKAMSEAITWFFEQVDYGIILEDDCLPEDSFFPYCAHQLEYHKDDPRIGMITGNSFLPETCDIPHSYYFSTIPHIWGWATWRRVWQHYDYDIKDWPTYKKNNGLTTLFDSWKIRYYWKHNLDAVYTHTLDTWDYQLAFACFKNNFLCIVPKQNLVANIGFGAEATHTHRKRHRWANLPIYPARFPLDHPIDVRANKKWDTYVQSEVFPWWKILLKKMFPTASLRWCKHRRHAIAGLWRQRGGACAKPLPTHRLSEGRVLINASNLHRGGVVQVASSFIFELSRKRPAQNFTLWVSTKVHQELLSMGTNISEFANYTIVDAFGIRFMRLKQAQEIPSFDVVFTLFGPLYRRPSLKKPSPYFITGFAHPLMIYPKNHVFKQLPIWTNLKYKVLFFLQKYFFKQSDHIVVELAHVQERLAHYRIKEASQVSVIHNCLNSVFFDTTRWTPLAFNFSAYDKVIKIGYLGRDYLHKNTNFIAEVAKHLSDKNIVFFVTFTEEEWTQKSKDFQSTIINVGPLKITECPSFYAHMDAIIFPSLLEAFSATPLETLAMKKPLFASDAFFIKDVCKDYAYYFDPMDPTTCAKAIADYFWGSHSPRYDLEQAQIHAKTFSSPENRAAAYLTLIKDALASQTHLGCK
jgi:hypothetical protein